MNRIEDFGGIVAKIKYIDMHVHFDNIDVDLLKNNKNILFIANSTDTASYKKNLQLIHVSDKIVTLFGIHPMKATETDLNIKEMDHLFRENHMIGEIGLDFFWIEDKTSYEKQRKIFLDQLVLAGKYNCIPSIHTKGAEEEILKNLRKYGIKKSLIHWYSGPLELIDDYLQMGCYFTIGPDILSGSQVYRQIPVDRMFAETDYPTGMPWITGENPRIDDIKIIYRELSKKLNISEKGLIIQFKENLKTLIQKI
jgi:TatD DNase family protein